MEEANQEGWVGTQFPAHPQGTFFLKGDHLQPPSSSCDQPHSGHAKDAAVFSHVPDLVLKIIFNSGSLLLTLRCWKLYRASALQHFDSETSDTPESEDI